MKPQTKEKILEKKPSVLYRNSNNPYTGVHNKLAHNIGGLDNTTNLPISNSKLKDDQSRKPSQKTINKKKQGLNQRTLSNPAQTVSV